jgi:hypothetical protein
MLKNFLSYLSTNLLVHRSSKWGTVRKQFLIDNGNRCACCSRTDNLNVHHIIPVHIDPSLELERANLIILCEKHCHWVYGHLMDWSAYNPTVIEDVKIWNEKIKNRLYH